MGKLKYFIVVFLIVVAFAGNFIRYSHRAPHRSYSDFRVYHATGERFLAREDIYARPDWSITPYKYSPTFAMLFSPLSLLPRHQASLVFFAINFLSVIAICFFCKRLIVAEELSYGQYWLVFFLTLLFTSRFILLVWDSGQVNLIMFLLVLVSLYCMENDRPMLSGATLALAALFKYMPLVFIPYLVLRGRYKILIYVMVFLLIFLAVPAFVVGFDQNIAYLKTWVPSIVHGDSFDKGSWFDNKNQSFYSMCVRYLTLCRPMGPSWLRLSFKQALGASLLFGAVIYLFVLFTNKPRKEVERIDYAALLICMAIFNPNAWMVNFVVYMFAYIYLLDHLIRHRFKDRITIALVFLSFVLSSWTAETTVGNDWEIYLERLSVVTLSALTLITSLFIIKFRKTEEERASSEN